MSKKYLAFLFLLLFIAAGVAVAVVGITIWNDSQVSTPPARGSKYQVVLTDSLKNADSDEEQLRKRYPYKSIRWGIAPSNLAWTTLTIELPNETDAADALATAFIYRTCDITTSLAPQVKSMAELWLNSDRQSAIEQIHGNWALSVSGYNDFQEFRFQLSMGWPEVVEAELNTRSRESLGM